jgi:hypothetical protein
MRRAPPLACSKSRVGAIFCNLSCTAPGEDVFALIERTRVGASDTPHQMRRE